MLISSYLFPNFLFAQNYIFTEYLQLPEEKIDITEGALLIEKELYPDLDYNALLKQVDKMTCRLDSLLRNPKQGYDTLTIINQFFFDNQGYRFEDTCNYLSNILENKCGNCASFSALYVTHTSRLSLPFYPVLVPSHCFVRYATQNDTLNIETTYYGDTHTNDWYAGYLGFHMDSINKEVYFRDISKKGMLAVMLNARANEYLDRDEYEKTIIDCNMVLEILPDMAEALINRGTAYDELDEPERALEDYTQALQTNPYNVNVYCNRGLIYDNHFEEYGKSIADYNRALEINPRFAEIYYNRGNVYVDMKEYQKAVNDYTTAIQLKPSYADAYFNRGCVFNMVGMWQEAIADYNKAIELGYENSPSAFIYRGDCKSQLKDKTGACSDWEKAYQLGGSLDNLERIRDYCGW